MFLRKIDQGVDFINRCIIVSLISVLWIMVGLVMLQIIVRFILPKFGIILAWPWTEELARFGMLWLTFLGTGIAAKKKLLISIKALQNVLPAKIGKWIEILSLLATGIFLAIAAWYGLEFALFFGNERAPSISMSMTWVLLALPVGFAWALVNIFVVLSKGADTT